MNTKTREYKIAIITSSICELFGDGYTFSGKLYKDIVNIAEGIVDSVEPNKANSFVIDQEDGIQFCQVDFTPDDCRLFLVLEVDGGTANLSSPRDKEKSWLNQVFV